MQESNLSAPVCFVLVMGFYNSRPQIQIQQISRITQTRIDLRKIIFSIHCFRDYQQKKLPQLSKTKKQIEDVPRHCALCGFYEKHKSVVPRFSQIMTKNKTFRLNKLGIYAAT